MIKIPPFKDAHVHLMIDGQRATPADVQALPCRFLDQGIISIMDMGHKNGLGLKFNKIQDLESPFPIRVLSAGWALQKQGGYGGFLGKGIFGEEEIKSAIKQLAEAGADFIKIINSGIVSLEEGKPVTPGGFSDEEWKVIKKEATLHDLPIRCHANSNRAIRQAVDFGVSSIEHGFFISRETLQVMAEKGVAWTPTAIALPSLKPFLSLKEQNRVDRIVDRHLETVHDAASFGVKLQVGTDSGSKGVRPGESFFKELQLFRKAGLTLDQILSAACLDQAEIEQGNYLLVEDHFMEMEKVEAVYINGVRLQKEIGGLSRE